MILIHPPLNGTEWMVWFCCVYLMSIPIAILAVLLHTCPAALLVDFLVLLNRVNVC